MQDRELKAVEIEVVAEMTEMDLERVAAGKPGDDGRKPGREPISPPRPRR